MGCTNLMLEQLQSNFADRPISSLAAGK